MEFFIQHIADIITPISALLGAIAGIYAIIVRNLESKRRKKIELLSSEVDVLRVENESEEKIREFLDEQIEKIMKRLEALQVKLEESQKDIFKKEQEKIALYEIISELKLTLMKAKVVIEGNCVCDEQSGISSILDTSNIDEKIVDTKEGF